MAKGTKNNNKVKDITPSAALSMIKKGALLVDVRENREIDRKAFDVKDFMSVPMSKFRSHLGEIPANRKVILACDSGSRSGIAARLLTEHGHKRVHNLQNGIRRWEREGLPVTSKPTQSPLAWLKKMFGKKA